MSLSLKIKKLDPLMEVYAVSGKGGVGKTTISGGLALALAEDKPTLVVDCDKKGRAITRSLFPQGNPPDFGVRESINEISEKLYASAIPEYRYSPLSRANGETRIERNLQFERYLSQFPRDYGIAAFQDMMSTFFGVNTNPESILSFVNLSNLLLKAEKKGIESVVLDLEPTQGTSRLLKNASDTSRILKNMSQYGVATLTMISAKFPDITRFLKSDYIRNAEHYGNRIERSSGMLSGAKYILVCGQESAKVEEMLLDTKPLIEQFGGKVSGYVINDIRDCEEVEQRNAFVQINKVKKEGKRESLPVIETKHDPMLCIDSIPDIQRRARLLHLGEKLRKALFK